MWGWLHSTGCLTPRPSSSTTFNAKLNGGTSLHRSERLTAPAPYPRHPTPPTSLIHLGDSQWAVNPVACSFQVMDLGSYCHESNDYNRLCTECFMGTMGHTVDECALNTALIAQTFTHAKPDIPRPLKKLRQLHLTPLFPVENVIDMLVTLSDSPAESLAVQCHGDNVIDMGSGLGARGLPQPPRGMRPERLLPARGRDHRQYHLRPRRRARHWRRRHAPREVGRPRRGASLGRECGRRAPGKEDAGDLLAEKKKAANTLRESPSAPVVVPVWKTHA